MHPQLNATRRIGAPGSGSPNSMGNRGSYKPPTLKRLADGAVRTPLVDLPANWTVIPGDEGDVKTTEVAMIEL